MVMVVMAQYSGGQLGVNSVGGACTLPPDLIPRSIELQLQLRHGPLHGVPRAALFTQLPIRVIEHLS